MIRAILQEIRVKQWYKNLVIFIPLIFAEKLFDFNSITTVIIGFVSLCLISSTNYILNDITDIKRDREHPEKKNRPVASGKISVKEALIITALLGAASLLIGAAVNSAFVLMPLTLFLLTQTYNLKIKEIPFADVHVIAVNFFIRTTAGSVALNVPISPWLGLTIFLLALFLGTGKRKTEMELLGENAAKHKIVYKKYTKEMLTCMADITATLLIIAYSLYTFLKHPENYDMMITIPFVTFIIFRYLYFIHSNNKIARKTELIFTDKQMMITIAIWLILSIIIIY